MDFSKSVLLMGNAYVAMMCEKIQQKDAASKEREEQRKESAKKRVELKALKIQKEVEKIWKATDAQALKSSR
jgi:hypothetical protein